MNGVPRPASSANVPCMTDRTELPTSRDRLLPILLYDGLCGFCNGTVRFILKRDARRRLFFAPLQGSTARSILSRHPELADVDSLILVESAGAQERAYSRSEAVLRIVRYLGGAWPLVSVLRLAPAPIRNWAYDLFARHRYRMFGRYDACPLPPHEVRARFLP